MKWSKEIGELIASTLKERGAPDRCPLCKTTEWTIVNGFFYVPLLKTFTEVGAESEAGLPCAIIICDNCGNMQWVNLVKLGLKHLAEPKE